VPSTARASGAVQLLNASPPAPTLATQRRLAFN